MALDRRLTRVQYSGDTTSAKGKLPIGMLVLGIVREQIRLSPTELHLYRMEQQLPDGTIIRVVSAYGQEQISIYCVPLQVVPPEKLLKEEILSVSGFICHPRSQNEVASYVIPEGQVGQPAMNITAVAGGWTKTEAGTLAELLTTFDYPLADSDNASFILTGGKDVASGYFLGGSGDYGNIYWHNNDVGNLSIISYKGIPTRHFQLTQQGAVTGADFATDGRGYAIYKGGVLLTNTRNGTDGNPEVIAGAAELDGEVICCTSSGVSVHRSGEWLDIPVVGWEPGSTWFFDSSGTRAINSSGTRILSFVKDDNGVVYGSQAVNYEPPVDNLLYFTVSQAATATTYDYVAPEVVEESCFEMKASGETANLSAVGSLTVKSEYLRSSAVAYADYVVYDDGATYTVSVSYDGIETVCATLLKNGLPASPPGLECGPLTYAFSNAVQIGSTACATVDPSIACCSEVAVISVGVTVTGSGVSAAGSIDITTVAQAGSWVRTASNLKGLHFARTSDPTGCTVGSYADDTDNAYYLTNGPPVAATELSTSYSPCSGTKTITYQQPAFIYVDAAPGGCYASGPNPTTAQGIDIISVGPRIGVDGGTCFDAPPCGPCWCVYWAGSFYAVQNIGTQTYTWVCS